MIENLNQNQNNNLNYREDVLYELQKDLIDEINENSIQYMSSVTNKKIIKFDLLNDRFFNREQYFGVLSPYNKNYTYKLKSGEGDIDNNLFYIKKNIVYSKYKTDNVIQNEYSIRIEVTDCNCNKSVKSFIIKSYVEDQLNLAGIVTCLCENSKTIDFEKWFPPFTINVPTIPKYGSIIKEGVNKFKYTAGKKPKNDIIYFNTVLNNQTKTYAFIIENFNTKRIDTLPKKMGNFTFDKIFFDLTNNEWNLGTFSTSDFYVFDTNIFIIGNLELINL